VGGSVHLGDRSRVGLGRFVVCSGHRTGLLEKVLARVGADRRFRGPIDLRMIQNVRERTGPSRGATTGPWPDLMDGAPVPPADSDHHGMPDDWETAHDLDPNDPMDGAGLAANGYTHVENDLNELAAILILYSKARCKQIKSSPR